MTILDSLVSIHDVTKIILATDRSFGDEAAAMLLAKQKNIDVILVSFAYSADFKSAYKLRNSLIYSFIWGQPKALVNKSTTLGNKIFYRPFIRVFLNV